MKLIPEKINYDSKQRFYWTRIAVELDDNCEAVVIIGASQNYIADTYKLQKPITEEGLQMWLQKALIDIETSQKSLKSDSVYRQVYSLTEEGRVNGMAFLMGVVP